MSEVKGREEGTICKKEQHSSNNQKRITTQQEEAAPTSQNDKTLLWLSTTPTRYVTNLQTRNTWRLLLNLDTVPDSIGLENYNISYASSVRISSVADTAKISSSRKSTTNDNIRREGEEADNELWNGGDSDNESHVDFIADKHNDELVERMQMCMKNLSIEADVREDLTNCVSLLNNKNAIID